MPPVLNPKKSSELNSNKSEINSKSKYICDYCNKSYSTNSNMSKHMKNCKEKKEAEKVKNDKIAILEAEMAKVKEEKEAEMALMKAQMDIVLGHTKEQMDFDVIYTSALNGVAGLEPDEIKEDMSPLLDLIIHHLIKACQKLLQSF